jgi:putative transposase
MIRMTLTPEAEAAVQTLRRDMTLSPAERDRVEMVLLSAVGWSPPRIATHLRCHAKTVRLVLGRFRAQGPPSLRQRRPGPPPDAARRAQVEAALNALLDQERTWTAAQLAQALTSFGIHLSTRQTRKYLGRIAAWRRTVRSLRHRQDPAKAARAKAVLGSLKKKPLPAASGSSTLMSVASPPASR